ncbi:hypothetical protein BD324DRAFT_637770 [Kockovaella imperatae]|uniref:BIR-domain-containing protein n=1 Tax=Kockovaella imperatae TaxID=4999 RepID=A0A1Y1U7G4_9TREE|nr:hypothetical protein BD324DRAFT_637770 [Kockovaella imperatae]ORX33948.1 hypothetical protein BD324DRAFT_637770 [Kockovaella imperatae]
MAAKMLSTVSMLNTDHRIASFYSTAPSKGKSKKTNTNQTIIFPLDPRQYPNLTPENLASAGFFFKPTEGEEQDDTCQCYLCGLQLGGWDVGDDPNEEHAKRNACPWAEFMCRSKMNRKRGTKTTYETSDDLPSSAQSSSWREATFGKWWPHKQKAGWLPTAKNLAKAGFVFSPASDAEDLVVCPLCEYGVEGWEATDDPTAIHYSKSPDCDFFVAQVAGSSSTAQQAPAKAPKGGKKAKRGNAPAPSESEAASENDAAAEDDAVAQLGHGKAPPIPRHTKPRVASRTRGRAAEVEADKEEEDAPEEATVEPAEQRKPRRGKGKSKAKVDIPTASEAESEPRETVQEDPEPEFGVASPSPKPIKARRGRKKKAEVPEEAVVDEHVEVEPEAQPVVEEQKSKQRGRKKKGKKSEPVVEIVTSQLGLGRPASGQPARSTRSASAKSQQSQVVDVDADLEQSAEEEGDEEAGESASEVEVAGDKTIRASSPPSKTSSKAGSTQSARPASQLDRFAIIPPSSPFQNAQAHSKSAPARAPLQHGPPATLADTSASETPRAKSTLVSSKPAKPSPRVNNLTRDALDKSILDGAKEARRVMDDLVLNTSEHQVDELTEEQKSMTLEDLVRVEMKKRYESMKDRGEEMIKDWEQKSLEARRRIESL